MEETPILRLNVYCLREIFSYLNIRELIQVDEVCERFQKLIQDIYRRQWKKLDFLQLKEDLNISIYSEEAEMIAKKVGAHVKELKIWCDNGEDEEVQEENELRPGVPSTILLNCSENLEHLHIENLSLQDNLKTLNELFPKLKSLKLINCDLSDNMIPGLRFAINLRILDLSNNMNISGSYLPFLRNVEEVSLEGSEYLDSINLAHMCENNPNIRNLNIFDCPNINQECINSLARSLQNLEILTIGYNGSLNLRFLADLPKLLHIDLNCGETKDVEAFLDCLAGHDRLKHLSVIISYDSVELNPVKKFSKLKYLRIFSSGLLMNNLSSLSCKNNLEELSINGCRNVNSKDLLKCVNSCKALKVLDVRFCQNITDQFVTDLLPHLSSRSGPLEIKTFYSGITKNLSVEHPNLKLKYTVFKNKIEISI
ncbi:hypothetical protein DMENIID0001_029660 [Sergentomyia squamirostris]